MQVTGMIAVWPVDDLFTFFYWFVAGVDLLLKSNELFYQHLRRSFLISCRFFVTLGSYFCGYLLCSDFKYNHLQGVPHSFYSEVVMKLSIYITINQMSSANCETCVKGYCIFSKCVTFQCKLKNYVFTKCT